MENTAAAHQLLVLMEINRMHMRAAAATVSVKRVRALPVQRHGAGPASTEAFAARLLDMLGAKPVVAR